MFFFCILVKGKEEGKYLVISLALFLPLFQLHVSCIIRSLSLSLSKETWENG